MYKFGCILALLLVCSAAPAADEPQKVETNRQRFPGNSVLNPNLKVFYVTSAEGPVEAVDLKTGKVFWRSIRKGCPILVDADNLYILAVTDEKDKSHPAVFVQTLSLKGEGKSIADAAPITVPENAVGDHPREINVSGRIENQMLTLSFMISFEGGTFSHDTIVDLKNGTRRPLKENPKLGIFFIGGAEIAGLHYDDVVDKAAAKKCVTCTEKSTGKLLWSYDANPGMLKKPDPDE